MRRQDWNLLALAASKGAPLTPVQLQKVLFLLGKRHPEAIGEGYYGFTPYHYGPYDAQVYWDATVHSRNGLATVLHAPGRRWPEYAATAQGLVAAEALRAEAPVEVVQDLETLITWARSLSFPELVRSVYRAYPEMKENSVFQG